MEALGIAHDLQQTPTRTTIAKHPRNITRLWKPLLLALAASAVGAGVATLVLRQHENSAVVATVNGLPITRQALLHRLELTSGEATLSQMIVEEEQIQFAQKQSALPTDAEVDAKLTELKRQPDFALKLTNAPQSPEDIRRAIRVNLIQQSVLTRGITVSEEDIRAFYRANTDKSNPTARYYRPETLQLAVVISDQENDITRAQQEIAAGKPFPKIVQECSKDQSKNNNGLLPPIQRGRMNSQQFPGLESRLFALKPGEQLEKVKINGAWWLIRCLGKTPETTIPFVQVQEECVGGARLTKGLPANLASMQSAYADFQKSAAVAILSPHYQQAKNQ